MNTRCNHIRIYTHICIYNVSDVSSIRVYAYMHVSRYCIYVCILCQLSNIHIFTAVEVKFFEISDARRAGQRGLGARLVTRVHVLGVGAMMM